MRIFHTLTDWLAVRQALAPAITLGFVPTMGNLHAGHASLYERSRQENERTVASLFINPTQFNQTEDFQNYPRSLEDDLALLETLGVDYCILPDQSMIYPDRYHYRIVETELSSMLEGQYRPSHFEGVLTVVMKLLNVVNANKAYFGEKDYQQYLLIKGMVDAFFMRVHITFCPTVREATGLAFSSRNNRLKPEERCLAEEFAHIFHHGSSCEDIMTKLQARGIKIDYIVDYQQRRFAAVHIGNIRLIDNYPIIEDVL